MKRAKNILLGGLVLQVITFGFFAFVAISFDWRSSRAPELKPYASQMQRMRKLWYSFYLSAVLITGRSIYRTAEFAEVSFEPGKTTPDGFALTHEWPMYIFDSVPIFVSTATLRCVFIAVANRFDSLAFRRGIQPLPSRTVLTLAQGLNHRWQVSLLHLASSYKLYMSNVMTPPRIHREEAASNKSDVALQPV